MTDSMTDKNAAKNADDIALIRALATILGDTDLTEIEIAEGEKRVKVKREITVSAAPTYMAAPSYGVGQMPASAPAAGGAPAAAPAADANANAMKSPMVGTTYLAPKPGDPPFVRLGDPVKEGQTVMIIEAMKVMNPIKADRSGTLEKVLVSDAEPIEFGQPLLVIA